MFFLSKFPGNVGYCIPLVVAIIYIAVGAMSMKELLQNMFSPVVIMMAAVIGVAAAMGDCGLSAYLGELIGNALGGTPSLLVLTLVFGFLTSISATLTGASFGSIFIFAPVGISLALNLGYNPLPIALACVKAGWINYFLPIDGMPALAMGKGKYKLVEFWKYVLPCWIIQMVLTGVLSYAFLK
jgi:di/tricarboxylate transporter